MTEISCKFFAQGKIYKMIYPSEAEFVDALQEHFLCIENEIDQNYFLLPVEKIDVIQVEEINY